MLGFRLLLGLVLIRYSLQNELVNHFNPSLVCVCVCVNKDLNQSLQDLSTQFHALAKSFLLARGNRPKCHCEQLSFNWQNVTATSIRRSITRALDIDDHREPLSTQTSLDCICSVSAHEPRLLLLGGQTIAILLILCQAKKIEIVHLFNEIRMAARFCLTTFNTIREGEKHEKNIKFLKLLLLLLLHHLGDEISK
ncbi:hypothetical protein BpHYR1_012522 [Brachionus plicatilis]|uniref:Secreted protein n=1 Tax=Brachionus plicatilis TaxID=10195 RepID=A0A3M7SCQ9_BRAPC|nr:hypothetical protein BpHYR1_012522 [Brachionus plicatilis]